MVFVKAKWRFVKRKLQKIMKNIVNTMLRNWLGYINFFGRHRYVLLLAPLLLYLLVMWPTLWWSMIYRNRTQKPPSTKQSPEYKMNRSLEHYLKNIKVIIEPTLPVCENLDDAPVIVLVASTTRRFEFREAVRDTWGIYQPTYFVMGGHGDQTKQLVANRQEASMFNDLLVFDFYDHHLNETLKTALMMKWTMEQCPEAQFLFKTEDDVMVNPWILSKVLLQNVNAHLVGYSLNDPYKLRSEHRNGYIHMLLREDRSLKYLSGTGYLIKASYIDTILNKAYQVPMISQEDVYFTYLVAHKELGLALTHDRRLSPYKPWFHIACVYWNQASIHSLNPKEMINAWYYLEDLVIFFKIAKNNEICQFFNKWFYVFSDFVLY